jgi:hypothetical protein
MFRMSAIRRGAAVPMLVLGILLASGVILAISFYFWNRHVTGQIETSGLPECPHYWKTFKVPHSQTATVMGDLSVPGPITSVPEFHDCQRFVKQDGAYGPLVAIFASFRLDVLVDSLYNLSKNGPFIPGTQITSAISVAEVFNQDAQAYPPLGIAPGFNCVHLYYDAGVLKARMVAVGSQEINCLKPFDPTTGGGTPLKVSVKPTAGFVLSDYPPVARWDWDSVGKQQYIGIKCGSGDWCEIGPELFTPSSADLDPSTATTPEARVRRIKGWYDEQYLDTATTADPTKFVPTAVKATVIPHPDLKTYSFAPGTWHVTAHVALDAPLQLYKNKFNFDPVTIGAAQAQMNRMEFCRGTRNECAIPSAEALPKGTCGPMNWFWSAIKARWWARILAASELTTTNYRYYCVIRRGHPVQLGVPGTARWRWLAKDPSIWEECTHGCCEVQAAK